MEDDLFMMNLLMLTAEAGSSTQTSGGGITIASLLSLILPFAAVILIFYFLIIRPEKKRNKEMQEMLSNIQVADEVITTGGIIGRVLSVKEDTVLIETGSDRTKIRVMKSSIAKNNTAHEAPEEVAETKPAKNKSGKTEIK